MTPIDEAWSWLFSGGQEEDKPWQEREQPQQKIEALHSSNLTPSYPHSSSAMLEDQPTSPRDG